MNRKGFTLIELLAVIVILAIIALIATPVILNIINDTRANAKQRSAELVYTGVQYAYISAMYSGIEGVYVTNPSLEDIKTYLNVDNVNPDKVTLDKEGDAASMLKIETDDGAYCEVTINNGLQVSCYSSTEKDSAKHYFTKYVQTDTESGEGSGTIVQESSKDWFTYDEATGTITGFSDVWNNLADDSKYDIVIPSTTPNGNTVVDIKTVAFSSKSLTSVKIPDSVQTIGSSAFYGNKLESLTIPDSVISISSGAFANNNLTIVDLGNKVQIIDSGVFYGNKLKSIEIPNSVQTIGMSAFYGNKLENLIIPDSVTSIGMGAFDKNNLITIEIGANVETIDVGAFLKNSTANTTLTKIINKTKKSFDWDRIINNLTQQRYTFETGIVGNDLSNVTVTNN